MAREFCQYPAPPTGEDGTPSGPDPRSDPGFYQIVQNDEVVAAYDSAHDRSLDAVIGDLLARGASGEAPGTWSEDHAIWRAGRRVRIIRRQGTVRVGGANTDPGAWENPGTSGSPSRSMMMTAPPDPSLSPSLRTVPGLIRRWSLR